jgi:hypothetical protein
MKITGKTAQQLSKDTRDETLRSEEEILKVYLSSSDWYVVRFSETGVPIPTDIVAQRELARSRISEIRNILSGEFI